MWRTECHYVLHRISSTGYVLHRILCCYPQDNTHRIWVPVADTFSISCGERLWVYPVENSVLHRITICSPQDMPHRICSPQDIMLFSTGYRCSPQDIGVLHRISSTGYVLHRIYLVFPTGYVIHRITPTAVLHCDYLLFPTAVPHRICPPQDIRSCGEHLPCSPQWFSTGYICPPQLFSTGYIAINPVENGCGGHVIYPVENDILWRTSCYTDAIQT